MLLEKAKEEIVSRISEITKMDAEVISKSIAITSNPDYGNLESRISFDLAKRDRKNPAIVAKEIADSFGKGKLVSSAEAKGPYVNFFLSHDYFRKSVKKSVEKPKQKKKKAIVEFPSVNPNKPWHIGHLRNALLGNSISNLLSFNGYSVEKADYIDDLGLQVAQSLWYYRSFPFPENEKFDLFVGKQYVEASKMLEANDKEIRSILEGMEKGEVKDAEPFVEKVLASQNVTGFDYGIYHDYMMFESTIVHELLPKGISMLKENGALRLESEGKNLGCWVLALGDEFKGQLETDKILIRSDGTTTYTGKDIIFHLWKFGIFEKEIRFKKLFDQPNGVVCYRSHKTGDSFPFGKADLVVNIIGVEQTHPQNIVKYAIRKLGYDSQADHYIHVAYGMVKLPEGKFSGRAGTWVGFSADDLMNEGMEKAEERMKEASLADRKRLVNAAIKYSFLKVGASKEVTFEWERALSMEGDSGPYLLYSFVRAMKILEKSTAKESFKSYNQDEKNLIFKMSQFSEAVESASKQYEPCIVANYLLELASMFHTYYAKHKVVGSPEEGERRAIVKSFANIMETGLGLLGIETLGEM